MALGFSITLNFIWAIFIYQSNARTLTNITADSPPITAILVFGDSQMDSGNNNFVDYANYKANYLPYGINFDYQTPSGRYCNGKVLADFITSRLGLKDELPPFLDPKLPEDDLSTGVNFASAGSRLYDIDDSFFNALSIRNQVSLFERYLDRLDIIVGEDNAKLIINNSLIITNAGNLDWLAYSHLSGKEIPTFNNSVTYQNLLATNVERFIIKMYNLGCRTMAVIGLPPIGCFPSEYQVSDKQCMENKNKDAQSSNEKIKNMLAKLQLTLKGSKLIFIDQYSPILKMIHHPENFGFLETKVACCGGQNIFCDKGAPICQNPETFLFWDKMHLTEAANRHLAAKIEKQIFPVLLNISR